MTDTFKYTEGGNVSSSAIDEVYFDAQTGSVLVKRDGVAYRYDGVTRGGYHAFVNSSSLGKEWKNFKRTYGPAKKYGYFSNLAIEARELATERVGSVKGLTETSSTKDTTPVVSNSYFSLSGDGSVRVASTSSRKYTVVFNTPESDKDRKYEAADVTSVDAAVSALTEVGAMLDLDFKVKGVYVSFE